MASEAYRGDASTISSSLLSDVRGGSELAWRRMVNLYGPLVYHWCRAAGMQPHDATEIVQDVFCAVLRNIQRFERTEKQHSFRGWLRTITNNKIKDEARRKGRAPTLPGFVEAGEVANELEMGQEESSDHSLGSETHQLLTRALDAVRQDFGDRTWQAFYRLTVQGQTAAEIGADLGMTAKAVRQAKYRVLLRLRSELEPDI